MLTPPDGLTDDTLVSVLVREWAVEVDSLTYRPVGFGSHHWEVEDRRHGRWFVTVDELAGKRRSMAEPLGAAFERLRASLAAAVELRKHGHAFAVAPIPTRTGEPVVRHHHFAVALYPFISGQSFEWGDFSTAGHRCAVLDLLVAVHTGPEPVRHRALTDDFVIPQRDEVEAGLLATEEVDDRGPYAARTVQLLAEHATSVEHLFARYDRLVAECRELPDRTVLTHGEPHPGNTMLASNGWLLIDWDTVLIALPERDLWHLDPGDGSILSAYAEATGVTPLSSALELYRLRWDLADLTDCVGRFRRPHTGSLDDDKYWNILRSLLAQTTST